VVLRADRDAAWQHVQLVLIECKEQDIHGTALAVQGASGEGRLDTPLPLDRDVVAVGKPLVEARIIVRASRAQPADAAGGSGSPTTRYQVSAESRKETGGRRTSRPLVEQRKAADREGALRIVHECHEAIAAASGIDIVVGELNAGHALPCGDAVAVLNDFRKIGVARVEFLYTWRPPEELRAQTPLPAPGQ
jgi:hypothetical protein